MKLEIVGAMVGLLLGIAGAVQATTISFDLRNISGNRYEYTYFVTNNTPLPAFNEFTIWFDYSLYSDLTVANTPNGWDPVVVQPTNVLGSKMDGLYDAFTLINLVNESTASGFKVTFDWLGAASGPGAQPFDIVNPDDFSVIESGTTILAQHTDPGAPVPEPGTIVLLGAGLAGLAVVRRRSGKVR